MFGNFCLFRHSADMAISLTYDCNIFLNRLSELPIIIKISKIRTKPNTILKLSSLAMPCENLRKIR